MKKSLKQKWIEEVGEENLHKRCGDGVYPTPHEYIAAGVDPKTYHLWYSVHGWDIEQMQMLEEAGIPIEQLGEYTNAGQANYEETIAYKFSNNDISLDEIKARLNLA